MKIEKKYLSLTSIMFVSRIFKCILVLIQHFGIVLKYANMGLGFINRKAANFFLKSTIRAVFY